MDIHNELGKGHHEVVYKDALEVELGRADVPFEREKKFEIDYKGVTLAHPHYADFVVWDKIIFEAKAIEKLTGSHVKQVLNYLAAANCVSVYWSISAPTPSNGSESSSKK